MVIFGPTASGKTELALRLARLLGGEILSIDSRQIYKKLDAGTAKPEGRWLGGRFVADGVACHLVDILDPREPIDAGGFCRMAEGADARVRRDGKLPILAGGAGMYLQAFVNGLDRLPPKDPESRARLESELERLGAEPLAARLRHADPASADWAGANPRRLVRALEVQEATGRPIREFWSGSFLKDLPADSVLAVGLEPPVEALDERIQARARGMWPKMLAECRRILDEGYRPEDPGLKSLGYPEALSAVLGKEDPERAFSSLVLRTRQYARRQRIWFRRYKNARRVRPEPGLEHRVADWWRAFAA